jgi:hypothetical protein
MKLHWIFNRYMAPAGADGAQDGGAPPDRGDDFTPTEDGAGGDAAPKKAAADAGAAADDPDPEEVELKAAAKRGTDAKKGLRAQGEGDEKDVDPDNPDADEDEAEKKPPAKKDSRVPLSRHKELLQKERERRAAVEQQLAQYQNGAKVAEHNAKLTEDEAKLAGLEKEYAQLLKDGKIDEATTKMAEVRKLERSIVQRDADVKLAAAEARAIETVRYNTALDRVEAAYPELNPDHDDFDKDKSAEVIEVMQGLKAAGRTPTDALQRAVKYVMGAPATAEQKTATTVKPRVDKDAVEEELEGDPKAAKAAERKEAATKKALDATSKTPPATKGVGLDSDKAGGSLNAKTVVKLPFEEFSKLDDATLARMRGDELV